MASLIRLKQIESGSALQTSADIGADFSQSVINIVSESIVGVLPDGIVTSSAQITLLDASGYDEFVVHLDTSMSSDLERQVVSASLAATIGVLSNTYVTTGSFNSYTQSFSSSVATSFSASRAIHNEFSSSLNSVYATDYEVYITASNIIDQGEF